MKILCLHVDYINFEVTRKAIKNIQDIKENEKKGSAKNSLVVFIAVEKTDEENKERKEEIKKRTIDEILDVYNQVKAESIVLYPYAHLSSNLAGLNFAGEIFNEIYESLKENFNVIKAPFGYYKAFELKCKGHPLSELSREINIEREEEKEETKETKITREDITKKITSEFVILTQEGEEYKIDIENLKSEDLEKYEIFKDEKFSAIKKFIISEEIKGQPLEEPPSIKAMRHLELVDYEPASDSGNFRMYPKGTLIFDLLTEWAEEIALNRLNSMKIETPIMYDFDQPDIRGQGESFHERHYTIKTPEENKNLVLRFAGDFGLFRIMKETNFSYNQLPLRVYEFSKSFRYERRKELSGLRRLRAFHMPDIHSFCKDIEEGWDEYENLYKNYTDLANATGIEYVVAFRIVKDFYVRYKDRIINLLNYSKKPAFIEILSEMKHYWAVKHEFQGIDSVNGNCQLSTVQLDVKDASLYGINFVDNNGKKKGCIICHSSIGSIERWMYIILEEALKKKKPILPLWLSPTQVRIIPVNNKFLNFALEILEEIEKNEIRVDIDDRDESLNAKIRKAEREWIPYILIIGEKEKETGKLSVRRREDDKKIDYEISELINEIKEKTRGMPFKKLYLSKYLSKRPVFVGYN